ncbi:MAG: hypothetical protein AB2826_23130 [Candidatus Thiodiazotropha sp.]
MKDKHTAIHEAGHATAHARLGIDQGMTTIVPNYENETLGAVQAEGAAHAYTKEEAENHVIAYCAGYAALIVNGCSGKEALLGTDGDFENAEDLIKLWQLDPLEAWKQKTVNFLSEESNKRVTERISAELLKAKTLDLDDIEFLVDIADGEATEDDYEEFKSARQRFQGG